MRKFCAIALLPLMLAAFAPQPIGSETQDRLSVQDKRRLSAEVTGAVVDQLIDNGCWVDHSDMAEAKRLRATIRIWLGPDGRFSAPPVLINPESIPSGDKAMQVFVAHAQRALKMCDEIGWKLPERSAEVLAGDFIELTFMPKIGARP